MFNRRCIECELTLMPGPFMVCDKCSKANERAINRMAVIEQSNRLAKIKVSGGTYKVTRPSGDNK